ncbi:MAG: ribonuclease III [Planctomycetes bacterium]|nr:ribonuclease III [Planctomycetota bacterium]
MSPIPDVKLAALEDRLGHRFADRRWLVRALTHSSAKTPELPSYERLEFLGDSILGFVVSAYLFAQLGDHDEGRLTKIKAQAVSRRSLYAVGESLGLRDYVVVGNMFRDRDTIRDSTVADAVEALIAAIYLDGGFDAAIDFVMGQMKEQIVAATASPGMTDYKSLLGQWGQRNQGANPVYEVITVEGPDHELEFTVAVTVNGRELGRARGGSKKKAEQAAARRALQELGEG